MKLTADQVKTPQDLLAMFRELGTAQLTALNGLLDKVPEPLKAEYLAMRDRMNNLLAKLPPLEQVPAAEQAAWALNSFARTIDELFEYADTFRVRISDMADKLSKSQTALNGLEEQKTKGELVDKATAQAATDQAVEAAKKPLLLEIAGMRKETIALCGLPDAPDSVLESATADFNASLAQAKKNLAACQTKGFSLKRKDDPKSGRGDAFIRKNAWLEASAFQGEAQTLDDLADTLKVKIPSDNDPMRGGGAGSAAGGEENKGRKLTIA